MTRLHLFTAILMTATSFAGETRVAIVGENFHINDKPTYEGRKWNGHKIEGLLFNMRTVQATFDDRNPATRGRWAYHDTEKWDADRNVREFCAAVPQWKAQGLLAFSVNFQCGSPEGYSQRQPWISSGFNPDGTLRDDAKRRMKQVIDTADANGMVVILGYFYFGQDQHLADEAAVLKATDEATQWVLREGWQNVLIEICNETDVASYDHEILKPKRVDELLERVRSARVNNRRLLAGTSFSGLAIPSSNVVQHSDFLLLHGNGSKHPNRMTIMVHQSRQVKGYKPMPILFNEDDHEDFDQESNNFRSAIAEHSSWGWFDYRRKGESLNQGFQSPPVDWSINSDRKKSFFKYLSTISNGVNP